MKKHERKLKSTDIAIVGISGRMPQAENIEKFKKNIFAGLECITREASDDGNYVNAQGIMPDAACFDNDFFGINDSDALQMDPQYRCILECAYNTLEDAGYTNKERDNNIGIFVGADESFYVWNHVFLKLARGASVDRIGPFLENTLASQISYKLNLTGPSLALKAACATSMVAVHTAIESLLNYDCNMALAGGVNIKWLNSGYQVINGMSSAYGQLRAYDSDADGFVSGNGLGLVALKRIEDAIEDKDHIYAVITGSSFVNDGNRKAGYFAAGVDGESEAIIYAMENAERLPKDILAIEGHGTATPLGDGVELRAIDKAYKQLQDDDYHCVLGSVKSNIGHLNTAAGIAGILKAIFAIESGAFPPSVNYKSPNPELLKINNKLFVTNNIVHFAKDDLHAIGVSSFGFGGVNCHMIIEEPPESEKIESKEAYYIVPISAKNAKALERNKNNMISFIQNHGEKIAAIAYTADYCREQFDKRCYLLCDSNGVILDQVEQGYEHLINAAQRWVNKDTYRVGQKFFKVPHKTSIPTYSFEKKEFFIEQIDVRNNNKVIGVVDGLSDDNFILSKYLVSKKENNVYVFTPHVERKILQWNDPSKFIGEVRNLQNHILEQRKFHFLHKDQRALDLVNTVCQLCIAAFWIKSEIYRDGVALTKAQIREYLLKNTYYEHLLDFILEFSCRNNILYFDNSTYSFIYQGIEPINLALERKHEEIKTNLPDAYELMNLLIYCTENYLDVFKGEKTGNEVLYPEGSYDLLKGIQSNGTAEETYCELAADFVSKLIPEDNDTRINILEIGAGTGELSSQVLEKIKERDFNYIFSDIGSSFLSAFKKQLSPDLIDKVVFKKLDITKPFDSQSIEKESIDIVLGVNVIQATSDIQGCVDRILEVLKPNGCLLMVQLYRMHDLQEMIFGLSSGWWNYREDLFKRNSPYFDYDGWIQFFDSFNVKNIHALPDKQDIDVSNAMFIFAQKAQDKFSISIGKDDKIKKREDLLLSISPKTKFITIDDLSYDSINRAESILKNVNKRAELIYLKDNDKTIDDQKLSLKERVLAMMMEILGVDQIDNNFIEIFDSLSLLILIAETEKLFNCKISPETLYSFSGVDEFVNEIQKNIKQEKQAIKQNDTDKHEGSLELLFDEVNFQ